MRELPGEHCVLFVTGCRLSLLFHIPAPAPSARGAPIQLAVFTCPTVLTEPGLCQQRWLWVATHGDGSGHFCAANGRPFHARYRPLYPSLTAVAHPGVQSHTSAMALCVPPTAAGLFIARAVGARRWSLPGHVHGSSTVTVRQCRSRSAGAAFPVHPTVRSSSADCISAGVLSVPNGPRGTSVGAQMSGWSISARTSPAAGSIGLGDGVSTSTSAAGGITTASDVGCGRPPPHGVTTSVASPASRPHRRPHLTPWPSPNLPYPPPRTGAWRAREACGTATATATAGRHGQGQPHGSPDKPPRRLRAALPPPAQTRSAPPHTGGGACGGAAAVALGAAGGAAGRPSSRSSTKEMGRR